jgi:hypothetical protein
MAITHMGNTMLDMVTLDILEILMTHEMGSPVNHRSSLVVLLQSMEV